MSDLKGILALFTACLSLCVVINFFLFYKRRKDVAGVLTVFGLIALNQLLEFITSFWHFDNAAASMLYITSFNFTVSFSVYSMLKSIQPESKQNWKSFIFTLLLVPGSIVYFSSFEMFNAGFFFTEYRYFASPLANLIVILLQVFWGLFFLWKFFNADKEAKKLLHNKILLQGYLIPPIVFIAVLMLYFDSVHYFESIFSKLMLLNGAGLLYFKLKQGKNA